MHCPFAPAAAPGPACECLGAAHASLLTYDTHCPFAPAAAPGHQAQSNLCCFEKAGALLVRAHALLKAKTAHVHNMTCVSRLLHLRSARVVLDTCLTARVCRSKRNWLHPMHSRSQFINAQHCRQTCSVFTLDLCLTAHMGISKHKCLYAKHSCSQSLDARHDRQTCCIGLKLDGTRVQVQAQMALPPHSCFQFFGLDFLVDSNCKAWLLEVNATPSMKVGCMCVRQTTC